MLKFRPSAENKTAEILKEIAEILKEILKENPEKRMTASDLARVFIKAYPEESAALMNKENVNREDDDFALVSRIGSEISAHRFILQKDNPNIKTTEGRPRKYFFRQATDSDEGKEFSKNDSTPSDTIKIKESELYGKLKIYLESECNVDSKRIDEKRSRNVLGRGGNKWLHPDMVGMEKLSEGWTSEIKDCARLHSDKKMKLWSFEVKCEIRRPNVREVFFQTVSNSSWANFGYLVAGEIIESTKSDGILRELRILSGLHGIGLILLDAETPSESQILIPAREKTEIDWNVANRIAETNTDFRKYIEEVVVSFYKQES